ncbi:MAG: NAD(P)-binding domain-containing protein, partial [Gemmatimonadaceae bacterium]
AGAPPEDNLVDPTLIDAITTPPDSAGERWEDRPPASGQAAPSLPSRFRIRSRTRSGRDRVTEAHSVVVATGYFGQPNRLGVPGEELPHVTHLFREGHEAFQLPVVVVGGGNSAVDAALDLYRAGARVTLVHFGPDLDPNVKPWVRPDAVNRIREGSIVAHFESRVTAIEPESVLAQTPGGVVRVPALAVYPMLGYQPNNALLEQLAVPMDRVTGIPAHDPATMETAVDGVYIAGVLASGFDANKTFIENGRHHGDLIARHLRRRRGA